MSTILLIDDDPSLLRVTEFQLKEAGYEVITAADGNQGWQQFGSKQIDLVLTDINMPGINGLELIRKIRKQDENIPIIIMTAYGSLDNAIQSTQSGADDYLTKPFSFEALQFSINKVLLLREVSSENQRLARELADKYAPEHIVGQSPPMKEIQSTIEKLSDSDATVLILGESGTGKELVARAIHFKSTRHGKAFIAVNCASIPENLMESELFGHVKGAFTGAIRDNEGKFEAANHGTLFLDEIGDLNLDLQAKLLRVLQEHEIQRVGENKVRKIDVRILAATHQNLQKLVQQRLFREDLFYRLNVVPITIPPLRERPSDIPLLIQHFIQKLDAPRKITISPEAMDKLVQYSWPGNIRELENLIERFSILRGGQEITAAEIPGGVDSGTLVENVLSIPFPEKGVSLEEIEKTVIAEALKRNGYNQTKTAEFLRMPRHVLLYRMKKFGL